MERDAWNTLPPTYLSRVQHNVGTCVMERDVLPCGAACSVKGDNCLLLEISRKRCFRSDSEIARSFILREELKLCFAKM